ncbi:MAG: hypothetical protein ABFD92_01390 [Planctomycetaceae bacterium]|nr:hypothetical protein [Planctomycetaceae bacterium]
MAHHIQAIIGSQQLLKVLEEKYTHAKVVKLANGFAMVPMLGDLHDEMGVDDAVEHDSRFMLLSSHVWKVLQDMSLMDPVAYIETEYFGGTGTQSAVAWKSGKVAYGPEVSEDIGPINKGLAILGIVRTETRDEFQTIGLQWFRQMDEFYEFDSEVFQENYVERMFSRYPQVPAVSSRRPWWKRMLGM